MTPDITKDLAAVEGVAVLLRQRIKKALPPAKECHDLYAVWEAAMKQAMKGGTEESNQRSDAALKTLIAALKKEGVTTI